MSDPVCFVRQVRIAADAASDGYPFSLPIVKYLERTGGLALPGGVSFFVGDNGCGKSTLLEAVAVAAGMNAEGGSQNYRFATRSTESSLSESLSLTWGTEKPRSRFFLRAESYYNVATETERVGLEGLGGISPHERSHGESFVDLMVHRFHPNGLYILDEPEAALSPQGCLAVLTRMADLVDQGCQLVVATHSPILLALPGATIFEIAEDGTIDEVSYDDTQLVRLTRGFMSDPHHYLRHLL